MPRASKSAVFELFMMSGWPNQQGMGSSVSFKTLPLDFRVDQ